MIHVYQDWSEDLGLAEHLHCDHGVPWDYSLELFEARTLVETHRMAHS